jgi:hypothetical protein
MQAGLKSSLATLIDRLERVPAARFYALLAGLALLVQTLWVLGAIFVMHLPDTGLGSANGSDSYDVIARNLIHHGRYALNGAAPTGYRPPLYPFFLAAMIEIFGKSWITGTILTQAARFCWRPASTRAGCGGSAGAPGSAPQERFRSRPQESPLCRVPGALACS